MQAAALSLVGAVTIFAIICKASEVTVRNEIERTASSEQADVLADAAGGSESMAQAVTAEIATSPGTFNAVAAPDGGMLGGNGLACAITGRIGCYAGPPFEFQKRLAA